MSSSSRMQVRKSSKSSNKKSSSLNSKPTTHNWNVNAQQMPMFNNVIARDNRPYVIMQTSAQGTVLQTGNAAPSFLGKKWTSADILQFSSFASVFDQYKIDFIEAWLVPFGPGTVAGYNAVGKLYSVIDYDDANTPTSIAGLQQYENCVTTRYTDGHYIKFKPHIAEAAYAGAFTGFANKPSSWIDVASTGVEHYGLKVGVETSLSNGDVKVDLTTRITVSFRNVF